MVDLVRNEAVGGGGGHSRVLREGTEDLVATTRPAGSFVGVLRLLGRGAGFPSGPTGW